MKQNNSRSVSVSVGQTGQQLVAVLLTIVIAAAVGYVGVAVTEDINDSVTDKDLANTDDNNQTNYENASENLQTGFVDAMSLVDITFLVLMFSVILGALLAFRGRR